MFFEATYVPSPPLSATSLDNDIPKEQLEDNPTVLNENATGFEDTEPASDKPVDHLIFVIHGIGQQTEQYGHFYEHIENLQETTRQVLQAKVPDHNVRIELIPIEWHRHIHEQVDPIINKITLKSIPTIRLIENDYLADVLFYFSKDRGQNIVNNVTSLFNTSYHNFMETHPDFDGKITILGYSLGGIIVWDILSHQRELQTEQENDMYTKMDINFWKLDFKPHYFFGLGSPIGAVLTFRGQDPTLYHPDFDIKFENVFHPFDPLGYRFEPLFHDYFTDKPAVLVERSVPLGPSFSFPSMPSFPLSAGFLSLFSWKQEEKSAKSIYDATSEAADAGTDQNTTMENTKQIPRQGEGSSSNGFMSSLFQYFSRGGGTAVNNADNSQHGESDQDNCNIQSNPDLVPGIITWDPLREQTREQLLALRDDLDRTLNNRSMDNVLHPKRPSINIRSKTYGNNTPACSIYSSSLEQKSDGSVLTSNNKMSSSLDIIGEEKQSERINLRKTMTDQQPKRQHLVEVLGIDGVRVDSFERARVNFDKHRTKSAEEIVKKDTDDTDDTELNADGGDNLWLDLNKELHKPGPAMTSPGESRGEVAQDATVPKSSDDDQRDSTNTDTAEEEEGYVNLLPGKNRMDFVLQPDSVMSMIANEYLIGLRAHFSYWTNKDFIWHMLRRIENLNCVPKTKNDKKKSSSIFMAGEDKSNVSLASTNVSNSENTTVVATDESNIVKNANKK